MTDSEMIEWFQKELAEVHARLGALEEAKQTDGVTLRSLQNSLKDLETRVDKVSIAVKGLANSLDQTNLNFTEWRRDLTDLMLKIAKLEERSLNAAASHDRLVSAVVGLDDKVTEGFERIHAQIASQGSRTSEEVRSALPTPPQSMPWYKDSQKLKEIAAAISIVVMTVMTAVNTAKVDQLPNPAVDTKQTK